MAFRFALAYSLIAVLVLTSVIAAIIYRNQQAKRRRRLRGIKTDEVARLSQHRTR